MALFERRRRPALPDDVRAAVPLDGGEQVLAWARDETSGAHVVATTHHLALVDSGGGLVWNPGRLPNQTYSVTIITVKNRSPGTPPRSARESASGISG